MENGVRPIVFVHLPAHLEVERYRRDFQDGIESEATPYGFHHGEEFGFDVRFSNPVESKPSLLSRTLYKILGFDPINTWRNRHNIRRADVVWTMLEGEALAIGLFKWLRVLPQRPLLGSTVWIVNKWDELSGPRRWVYRKLLGRASVLFVHSEACLSRLREIVPAVPVYLLPFGVSESTYLRAFQRDRPESAGPIRIIAAGNDRTRDWDTLLEAFGGHDGFELAIACKWLDPRKVRRFSNVTLLDLKGSAQLAELYRSADVVAVPMSENLFSGITVALEAAATGTPLLSSRTGGVPTYLAEDEAIFVPVGDAIGMRTAISSLNAEHRIAIAERAHRRFLREDYTSRGMIKRYARYTYPLLQCAPS